MNFPLLRHVSTYIVDSVSLVCNLSIASLAEGLVHLSRIPCIRVAPIDWNGNWINWLFDLCTTQCVPIFTSASKCVLARIDLILVLVDLHVLLSGTLVANLILTMPDDDCKRVMRCWRIDTIDRAVEYHLRGRIEMTYDCVAYEHGLDWCQTCSGLSSSFFKSSHHSRSPEQIDITQS